jgi:hypothetical protein
MKLRNFVFSIIMLAGFAACTSEGSFDFGSDSTVDSTAVTEQVVVTPEASPTTTTPSTRPKPKVVEPLPTTPQELPLKTDQPGEEEVVEVTPAVFFDCDHKRERREARCTEKALQEYVEANLEFEGEQDSTYSATVSIGIRSNGSVGLVKVLTSSHDGFGASIARTIKQLNTDGLIWTPAMQGEEAVSFEYFTEFIFEF